MKNITALDTITYDMWSNNSPNTPSVKEVHWMWPVYGMVC